MTFRKILGTLMLIVAFAIYASAFLPQLFTDLSYWYNQKYPQSARSIRTVVKGSFSQFIKKPGPTATPTPTPIPLLNAKGEEITPINTDFALVIPKINLNTAVIADIDPTNPLVYEDALKKGVAHSVTSYYPNENGTVYLFSHSTNYEWFVKDLNAVFYLVRNLEAGDLVTLFYQGNRYDYRVKEKKIVKPNDVSYLVPQQGKRELILQTCWPPGSNSERLILIAE